MVIRTPHAFAAAKQIKLFMLAEAVDGRYRKNLKDEKIPYSTANIAALKSQNLSPMILDNGSDNKLLVKLNNITGCQSFKAPDLANGGVLSGAGALNALSAQRYQGITRIFVNLTIF